MAHTVSERTATDSRRFPRVEVDLSAIRENAAALADRLPGRLVAVTKGVGADPFVARAMLDGGADLLADSRIANLDRLSRRFDVPLQQLRIPMRSELDRLVAVGDGSLHSDLGTIRALGEAADRNGITHRVFAMVDVGDRREGVLPEDLADFVGAAADLPGVDLAGIGTNFACLNGVRATPEKFETLRRLAANAESVVDRSLEISVGGSAVLSALGSPAIADMDAFRIGEALLLGTEPTSGEALSSLRQDAFRIEAEVVELRRKPAAPEGETGNPAFGAGQSADAATGRHRRAILGLGHQDVDPNALAPIRSGLSVVGASSDHTVVRVPTGAAVGVGDSVAFRPGYSALLRAFTTPSMRLEYR